jgi:hypothetical protein
MTCFTLPGGFWRNFAFRNYRKAPRPAVIARRPQADEAIQEERDSTLAAGVIWIASPSNTPLGLSCGLP